MSEEEEGGVKTVEEGIDYTLFLKRCKIKQGRRRIEPSSDIYAKQLQKHLSEATTNETKSTTDAIKLFAAAMRLFTRMAMD